MTRCIALHVVAIFCGLRLPYNNRSRNTAIASRFTTTKSECGYYDDRYACLRIYASVCMSVQLINFKS